MKIDGTPYRTIWPGEDGASAVIIDQTRLPHRLETVTLRSVEDAAHAILSMQVRGAPLIGAAAAYGLALALQRDASDRGLDEAAAFVAKQRPTAVNLKWALEEVRDAVMPLAPEERRCGTKITSHGASYRRNQHGRRITRSIGKSDSHDT